MTSASSPGAPFSSSFWLVGWRSPEKEREEREAFIEALPGKEKKKSGILGRSYTGQKCVSFSLGTPPLHSTVNGDQIFTEKRSG